MPASSPATNATVAELAAALADGTTASRTLAEAALETLPGDVAALYSDAGRPSIPPEQRLRAPKLIGAAA